MDCNTHSSEDEDIYTQNDTDSGKDDYVIDTDITQWTDIDSTFCACWPHDCKGSQWVTTE